MTDDNIRMIYDSKRVWLKKSATPKLPQHDKLWRVNSKEDWI